MFGLGPVFAMIIEPRLVRQGTRSRARNSVLGTNATLAVIVAALCWLIGWKDLLMVWAPPALLAGSVGIWLFYVQHQFGGRQLAAPPRVELRQRGPAWQLVPEAPETGAVLHRQHRFAPCPSPQQSDTELQPAARPRHQRDLRRRPDRSIRDGLQAVNLKLWDEDTGQLVGFAQANPTPNVCSRNLAQAPNKHAVGRQFDTDRRIGRTSLPR